MGRAGISVGDDTPTGEPQNGPSGPYITDDSDDASRDGEGPAPTPRARQGERISGPSRAPAKTPAKTPAKRAAGAARPD